MCFSSLKARHARRQQIRPFLFLGAGENERMLSISVERKWHSVSKSTKLCASTDRPRTPPPPVGSTCLQCHRFVISSIAAVWCKVCFKHSHHRFLAHSVECWRNGRASMYDVTRSYRDDIIKKNNCSAKGLVTLVASSPWQMREGWGS